MSYILISSKTIYADILYGVYNEKKNEVSYLTYNQLYGLLLNEKFLNLSLDDGKIVGVNCNFSDYLNYTGTVYTCISRHDSEYKLISSNGNISVHTNEELSNYKVLNMSIDISNSKRVKKRKVLDRFYLNHVYFSFTEDDELVMMCNSVYSTSLNKDLKLNRATVKYCKFADDELSLSGLKDSLHIYFYKGVDRVEIQTKSELYTKLYDIINENYKDLVEYEEKTFVYVTSPEIDLDIVSELNSLEIKNT